MNIVRDSLQMATWKKFVNMDENRTWTVYEHISPSNKVYIGITNQAVKNRWKNGMGYLECSYFFGAIVKYGWINIKHNILATNLTQKEAKDIEIRLIAENKKKGISYNITDGGEGTAGVSRSVRQRRLISNSLKLYYRNHSKKGKYKWSKETRIKTIEGLKASWTPERRQRHKEVRYKPVIAYNLITNQISEFTSKIEASEKLNISSSVLGRFINKGYCSNGVLFWYKNEKTIEEALEKMSFNSRHGGVVQLGLNNTFIALYKDTKEASSHVGINRSCIIRCCLGENKTSAGYKWVYLDKYIKERIKLH